MLVLDDFLERTAFLMLRSAVEAPGFRWQSEHVLSPGSAELLAAADNRQDVHGMYLRRGHGEYLSDHFGLVRPVVERLQPAELIKVKLNRTPRRERHVEYGLHVDTRRAGATTAILYLNSNNGYTLFEDGERVVSVANRIVVFDAARRHTGASCTDADYRLVLNVNLIRRPGAGDAIT
ncbi:MAG: denV, Syn33 [Ramlibacter sp.]|nr:denV, Syn33 [Ramlibacter sp.]